MIINITQVDPFFFNLNPPQHVRLLVGWPVSWLGPSRDNDILKSCQCYIFCYFTNSHV